MGSRLSTRLLAFRASVGTIFAMHDEWREGKRRRSRNKEDEHRNDEEVGHCAAVDQISLARSVQNEH